MTNQIGENNFNSKLKQNDIDEIRKLYSTLYYSKNKLAKIFGISQPQISRIISKINWK
jgi:predicted transcriptional regulator